jgi:hypothetical protein
MEQNCPGGSNRPLVHLFIIGRARLVRVADGKELYANEFRYDSPPREFAQWSTNNAKALATELETGYRDLADRMHDELLMVTPIALPVPSYWLQPGDPLYLVCWLYPVFPAAEMKTFAQSFGEAFSKSRVLKPASGYPITPLLFTAVDSLTPLIRWSAFPRDIDREKLDPAVLARIRDITYDLQVWDVEQDCRGGLVYEYIGLTEPLHKIEKPLEPGRRYFWSFRARFTLDGQPMTTRWASLRYGSCDRDMITEETYYRFVTPKEQQ